MPEDLEDLADLADLADLNGVGEATAEKLAEAGIEEPGDLAGGDAENVTADVQGVSASQVREWKGQLLG